MVDRSVAFLGFPNVLARPYCTASVAPGFAAAPVGFEPTYLQTEEPSDKARIIGIDPLATRFDFTNPSGIDKTLTGMALVNSNLSRWGKYRFTTGIPTYQNLAPTSIISSTNRSGAVTDVDELISSLDGVYMSPTVTASNWDVQLGGFATPTLPPKTGPAMAMFVVAVVMVGAPVSTYPLVQASLYQSTTLLSSLGVRAVTSTTTQIFIFDFDPSILQTSSGANIRVSLVFQHGDGGSYAKLDACRLYVDNSTVLTVANDSGWISSSSGYNVDEDTEPPTLSLSYFPPSSWLMSGSVPLSISILDDQVDHTVVNINLLGMPVGLALSPVGLGYIEAGVAVAGTAIFLSVGPRKGRADAHVTINEIAGNTIAGQTYGADGWRRRETDQFEVVVTRDEGLQLENRIAWRKGHSGAFFFSADPDLPAQYRVFTDFWATLSAMSGMIPLNQSQRVADGTMLHTITMQLSEKL